MRQFSTILLALILSMGMGLSIFADDFNSLTDKKTKDTEQFLFKITRPEGDESTYKRSYLICGNSKKDKDNLKVSIFIEKDDGKLEPFKNTNGEESWDVVQKSGLFMKEIVLPNVGENRIRIAAFRKNNITDSLIRGENLQVNTFTVNFLSSQSSKYESKYDGKHESKSSFFRFNDVFGDFIFKFRDRD